MKKRKEVYTPLALWGIFWLTAGLLACKSDEEKKPDIVSKLTEKWWCDSNQTLADQYFDSDGTFSQRYSGTTETGKWSLSAGNTVLTISDVQGNILGNWTYTLKSVTDNQLIINFLGSEVTYQPCP